MILYIFFEHFIIINSVKIRQISKICHLSKFRNHPSYSVFNHALKCFRPLRYQWLSKLLQALSIIFNIYQTFIESCNEIREQAVTVDFYFLNHAILDIVSDLNQSPWEFLFDRILKWRALSESPLPTFKSFKIWLNIRHLSQCIEV